MIWAKSSTASSRASRTKPFVAGSLSSLRVFFGLVIHLECHGTIEDAKGVNFALVYGDEG